MISLTSFDTDFVDEVMREIQNGNNHELSLKLYLFEPIQRMSRYPLLLHRLHEQVINFIFLIKGKLKIKEKKVKTQRKISLKIKEKLKIITNEKMSNMKKIYVKNKKKTIKMNTKKK